MTREQGLKEIDEAKWIADEYGWHALTVHDEKDQKVISHLYLRPDYCDRGHIQLNIDGNLGLDNADCFPRFFFNSMEADCHVRTFLKWRLWKERTYAHTLAGLTQGG